MSYKIYVKNEQGNSIVNFGESTRSRFIASDLWEMKRKNKISVESGKCHLEEIYRLDNHIAIPFLVKHIEQELESLKSYLKEPMGKWDYQKDLFRIYGERLSSLKNLTDGVLIFHVWDMS